MLQHPLNAEVLRYLTSKSAHSDIAELLRDEVDKLQGACHFFQAQDRSFRPLMVCRDAVVFAFAVGQFDLGFRLPENDISAARTFGGRSLEGLDPIHWIAFSALSRGADTPALSEWLQRAYNSADIGEGAV
jgi:hypothetical protein